MADDSRAARDVFALLLADYSHIVARSAPLRHPREIALRELLEGFKQARGRSDATALVRAAGEHALFGRLLAEYETAADSHRLHQEGRADDFNLFAVLKLVHNEIRHSMALAWLLDRDMRKLGTHAQGNLGFRLFLQQFGLPPHYATCRYWVRREVRGDGSIVDIEIACRSKFLIHIENKIRASEGVDQTNREWADVQRRAEALDLEDADSVDAPVHALFLTPRGDKASNRKFQSISYGGVIHVLEAFADQAKPDDVKLFASHYARTLRRFVTQDIHEDKYGDGIDE
jgi:hypothetical protein